MRDDARPKRRLNRTHQDNDLLTCRITCAIRPQLAHGTRPDAAHPRPGRRHNRHEPQSILRAIKRGALSGTKDHNDVWHVDGAELARVFPVTPNTQPAHQDTHPDALAAHKLAVAEERIADLKNASTRCGSERDRARAGEDAWKAQCER